VIFCQKFCERWHFIDFNATQITGMMIPTLFFDKFTAFEYRFSRQSNHVQTKNNALQTKIRHV